MKYLIIALIFFFNQLAFACDKPVSYLQKGQVASCNGYLFSPEQEKEVRDITIKFNELKMLSAKQDELNSVLNQRIFVISEQNYNLREELKKTESSQTLETIIYFSLGIVLGLGMGKVFTK